MSIMRLRKIFNRPVKIQVGKRSISLGSPLVVIFWGIVIVFVVGAFTMYGGAPQGQRTTERTREVTKVVAQVNKYKINRAEFEQRLRLALKRQRVSVDIPQLRGVKTSVLDGMIQHHLLREATKTAGLQVTRQEVKDEQLRRAEATINSRFPDQKDLRSYLDRNQISYEKYRQRLLDAQEVDQEMLRETLLTQKLVDLVRSQVKLTDEQVKQDYEEVKVTHILITPQSFLAESEKETESDTEAKASASTLTPQQAEVKAQQKAQQLLKQIRGGADFAELAQEHSAGPYAEQSGDVGWIRSRQRHFLPKEVEDAAFALKPGQVSDVIRTQLGFHIIKVADQRTNLPDDFDEKKEVYKQRALSEHQWQAWEEYQNNLREQANIQIFDHELQAYQLLADGNEGEVTTLLAKAAENDPYNMSARYQLAMLHKDAGEAAAAINYLQQILEDAEQGARSPQVHFELAELLREQGQTEEALDEYKLASDRAFRSDAVSNFLHMRLRFIFEELKKPELVKQEEDWLAEFNKQQEQGGFGGFPIPGG